MSAPAQTAMYPGTMPITMGMPFYGQGTISAPMMTTPIIPQGCEYTIHPLLKQETTSLI